MAKCWQNFFILILNFCSGGVGTIISPFILEENCNCRKILIAIIIGIIQILHFVHILSLIFKFQFIDNFYDIIGGENILIPFLDDRYKVFINNTKEIEDSIEPEINPNEILSKNSRISFLKIFMLILSGLSYINSNLTPFIDLIKGDKAGLKIITYGIFNPGAGVFISAILFFNEEYRKIIFSLIGVLFGILLMVCPYILGIGLYLTKIIKNIVNLFLIKFLFTYFGALGTIYSLIYAFLQKDIDINDDNNGMFDIYIEGCSDHEIKSNFNIYTIIRIISNIILPGSGVFSLMCKFRCHVGLVFIGILQIAAYFFFWLVFFSGIMQEQGDEENYLGLLGIFCFLLTNIIAGILIIFISEYFEKRPTKYNGLGILPLTILNLTTGGYGNFLTIFNDNNCFCKNKCGNCIATFLKIIWCFLGMYLQLSFDVLIFTDPGLIISIVYSLLYILYIIISFIFHLVGRNKENEESEDYGVIFYTNRNNNREHHHERNNRNHHNNNIIYRREIRVNHRPHGLNTNSRIILD